MNALAQLGLTLLRDPRSRRLIIWAGIALGAVSLVAGLIGAALLLNLAGGASRNLASGPLGEYCVAPASTQAPAGQWSAEQVTNAATIARVGEADKIPPAGWVIAVATAMQESSLLNLNHGDRDSLGLFQQRPSQGWGTPAQIMDPVYASNQFYLHLLQVSSPDWQDMPLTDTSATAQILTAAAQAVQRSAFPQAYAAWTGQALALVGRLARVRTVLAAAVQGTDCSTGPVPVVASARLTAVLRYAYAALGSSYVFGGSCTSPHSPDLSLHCDCSSLVQQSFLHGAGLQLPRTAEEQWEYGEAGHAQVIPLREAQPGDVVYYPTDLGPDTIGHTGIIVDPRQMIMVDAPRTGEDVHFANYSPSGLPYGTHLFTILRFAITRPAVQGSRA